MSGLQINLVLEPHSGLNPTCFCSLKEHLNIEASPPPRPMRNGTFHLSGIRGFLIDFQTKFMFWVFLRRELLVLFLCSYRSFSNTEQVFIHVIWTFQQNFGFKFTLNRNNTLNMMN